MSKFNLEERLIEFTISVLSIAHKTTKTYSGIHLAKQLVRSGTSVSLNYGEAQSGESRKDFIHKMKIILKELRETSVCLRIIKRIEACNEVSRIESALKENNELISIIVKSIQTAQRNMASGKI